MAEANPDTDRDEVSEEKTSSGDSSSDKKKSSKQPLIIVLCVVAFAIISSIFQKEETIDWVRDYQAGIAQAEEQNKPVLLAFYKKQTRFCSLMDQNTYNNSDVKKYVEANFVPVFIDVDKEPEIARKFGINYYPTHYVKMPNSSELIGPQMGYDVPVAFIKILEGYLERANAIGK